MGRVIDDGPATITDVCPTCHGSGRVDVEVETEPVPKVGEEGGYDPADHTVDDVLVYLAGHPDEAEALLEAEYAGKDRKGVTEAALAAMENPDAEPAPKEPGGGPSIGSTPSIGSSASLKGLPGDPEVEG